MIQLEDGHLILDAGFTRATLTLSTWRDGAWQPLALQAQDDVYRLSNGEINVWLRLDGDVSRLNYDLGFQSTEPTRLQLRLDLPGAANPFHLIPGNIYGDNNLERAEPGHYPNLTRQHPENVSCSTYWEFRADRAALPLSAICFEGGVAALSIEPYGEGYVLENNSDGFLRNGVFSQLAHDNKPNACGVTLGYGNAPVTFLNKDQWEPATEHLAYNARTSGSIFLRPAQSRLAVHDLIREVYNKHRSVDEPRSVPAAVAALTDAFLNINWQPERENFSNMRCIDDAKNTLTAWRTLAEVGWTGGGVIGYPLLIASQYLNDATARERANYMLDWVAQSYNPASGLLWDVYGKHEGKHLNWWWSGYIVKDCHCAYTNGSGLYFLLKSFAFSRDQLGSEKPDWLQTGLKALDTMVQLQEESGNFGFTYSPERPEILDREGFAGVWFVPALAIAYQLTGDEKYLESARRGIAFYHGFVRDINCWGTPLDTWKSVDQEGNLGFIRGAALLHRITGEAQYLQMLEDGAHYEYTWRYGFKARAEYPPLKDSHWNSCGGSITSVSNPHLHPMGIFVSADLKYLAEQTGDEYHQARYEDGIAFALNIISLYPEVAGYGAAGVITERFCPSDGLTIETYPDGSPSSIWFSYNGWAAAAALEGLVESSQ